MGYEDAGNPGFWEEQWEEAKRSSFLSESQAEKPEGWLDFFDSIGDIYMKIWGNGEYFGKSAVSILLSENLIHEGAEVLDAGCGPGTIAIPMAEEGAVVTGLDYSPAMLNVLKQNALKRNISNIRTVCSSFENYSPESRYDLVTASFAPPSLNPSGIKKMESWTKGSCAMMVGAGSSSQKLQKALWQEVMERPAPISGTHLIYLTGYLMASGRMPNIKHISNLYLSRCPVEDMVRFYTAYFNMFRDGKAGSCDSKSHEDDMEHESDTKRRVSNALKQFTRDNFVEYEEEMNSCLIWWKKP